ncbi:Rv1678 family membrane protein [Saccharomonospora halophila]|uniref:Rv1678 family membrane protein n=1 Tax=Saccharomonospora halophila TaxID=129922 RepID=UPI00036B08D8|nr:hypothetical protein [Saccharomonospora halophila]
MNGGRLDRAAVALGVGGLLTFVFTFSDGAYRPYDFLQIQGVGLVVILALSALGLLGGLLRKPLLVLASGVAFAAAAIIQLVQAGRSPNWLEGDGSTLSVLLALAAGLLAVGFAARRTSPNRKEQ